MSREATNYKLYALGEMLILILGVIAVGYVVGDHLSVVGATQTDPSSTSPTISGGSPGSIGPLTSDQELIERLSGLGGGKIDDSLNPDSSPEPVDIPGGASVLGVIGSAIGKGATGLWKFVTGKSIVQRATLGAMATGAAFLAVWATNDFADTEKAREVAGSVGLGYTAGTSAAWALKEIGAESIAGPVGWVIGVGLVVWKLLSFKQERTFAVSFECFPWQAQTKGEYCELCNEQEFGCSEYQCRSLGQGCELINQGTGEEQCIWKNRGDIDYPIIEAWNKPLGEEYRYTPDNAISPPNRGVTIDPVGSADCIGAFTPFSFGVSLDENAQCKFDVRPNVAFSDMDFFFSQSVAIQNHSYTFSLPGASNVEAENVTLANGGTFSVYVKCQDINGNDNPADFVFSYCIDDGPDTTQPLIVSTSIADGSPIQSGITNVSFDLYTNEPAQCKWSHEDKSFVNMETSLRCATSVIQINAQNVYSCSTTLTGIKDSVKNDFYFRCNDSSGNDNRASTKVTLIGTEPLVISDAGPTGIVRDAREQVKVTLSAETSAGYNEGEAVCSYSDSCWQEDGSNVRFNQFIYPSRQGSYTHSYDIWVAPGTYDCVLRCVDAGGNADIAPITYTAQIDLDEPIVVRAYKEDNNLKIITDEESVCVYGTTECNYLIEDSIALQSADGLEHMAKWHATKTYYIKCVDDYGNPPAPNQCSIIVRAQEDYSE